MNNHKIKSTCETIITPPILMIEENIMIMNTQKNWIKFNKYLWSYYWSNGKFINRRCPNKHSTKHREIIYEMTCVHLGEHRLKDRGFRLHYGSWRLKLKVSGLVEACGITQSLYKVWIRKPC